MKKFTLFLVALFIATMAFADKVEIDGIYYNLNDENKTAEVTYQYEWYSDNYSSVTSILIPEKVTYNATEYSVTSIGKAAFAYCPSLTSIAIGNSVTSIGDYAFQHCSSLTSINVDANNQNYTSIDGVLYNKNITNLICCPEGKTSITIPNSITSIEYDTFSGCSSLISITIPNSVTSIENYAFSSCSSLTSITIPNSVTEIGYGAFQYCSSLTSINVDTNHPRYTSIDGVLYSKDITTLICCPGGKTDITIPNSVTFIEESAFYYCKYLTSITIPNSVTSIGRYAFSDCLSLNTITCLGSTPPKASDLGAEAENLILKVPSEAYNDYLQHAYWGQFLDEELLIKTNPAIINKGYNGEIIILYNPFAGNKGMIDATECYAHTGLITMESSSSSHWFYPSAWRGGEDKYKMTKEGDFWKLVIPNIYEYYECPESEEILKLAFVFNDGPNGNKEGKTVDGGDIFINLIESTIEQYEIIVTSNGNGNVIGGGFYNENEEAILTATPNDGYRFAQWTDGNTDNPRTIIVTQDSTFTAEFALEEFALYVTSASPELGYVKHTIEAIAIEGFEFDRWSDDNTDNPRTIILTEDTKLYAYFRMATGGNPVDLETAKISSANVYANGGVLYVEGATSGYHVLDTAGRLVYSGSQTTLALPRGIYLVTINGEVEKIVL